MKIKVHGERQYYKRRDTGHQSFLAGRDIHHTQSVEANKRTMRHIFQVNALRRQWYTLDEIGALLNLDPSTMCLRSYGIATHSMWEKEHLEYRRMHRGAYCIIDYYFIGIGDNGLVFGTKKQLEAYNRAKEEKRKNHFRKHKL